MVQQLLWLQVSLLLVVLLLLVMLAAHCCCWWQSSWNRGGKQEDPVHRMHRSIRVVKGWSSVIMLDNSCCSFHSGFASWLLDVI